MDETSLIQRLKQRALEFRGSTSGRILSAATTVAMTTAVVKFASLAKDVVVARRFGTGDGLDAFYIAILVPTFLVGIFGESFRAALVPVYVELHEAEGKKAAERLLSNIGACSLVALLGISLPVLLFRPQLLPLLASGFAGSKQITTELLIGAVLALLPLWGLTSLWRAALTAHDKFAVPSLAPITKPALMLVAVLTLSWRWGVYSLVAGAYLGAFADLMVCGQALVRAGISPWPRWHGFDVPLRRVLWQCAPLVGGMLMMGSTTVVDQSMAAMLGGGSVSALNYANKLLTLPMWVGVHSMSVAVFPSFSKLSARRDWGEMRTVLSTYTRLILLLSVPFTLLLYEYSEPLVKIIFGGGAFTGKDIHLVGRVQALLCLQLPFFALGILYVRAISAIKRNQILMWGTAISVTANAGLNVLFMRMMGLPGIALSTSVVYVLSFLYLRFMLFRVLSQHETDETAISYVFRSDTPAEIAVR